MLIDRVLSELRNGNETAFILVRSILSERTISSLSDDQIRSILSERTISSLSDDQIELLCQVATTFHTRQIDSLLRRKEITK